VFENRVLRGIFGLKRDEVTEGWGNYIMRSAWHVTRMGRSGTHIRYWWESQRERENIKMDLRWAGVV
jgi:hypothetical protein